MVNATTGGVIITLHVQPKAKRNEIVGIHGDALKVRVQAPPSDGAANKAVIELLAARLDVPRSALSLQSGHASRRKTLLVQGLTVEETLRSLGV